MKDMKEDFATFPYRKLFSPPLNVFLLYRSLVSILHNRYAGAASQGGEIPVGPLVRGIQYQTSLMSLTPRNRLRHFTLVGTYISHLPSARAA